MTVFGTSTLFRDRVICRVSFSGERQQPGLSSGLCWFWWHPAALAQPGVTQDLAREAGAPTTVGGLTFSNSRDTGLRRQSRSAAEPGQGYLPRVHGPPHACPREAQTLLEVGWSSAPWPRALRGCVWGWPGTTWVSAVWFGLQRHVPCNQAAGMQAAPLLAPKGAHSHVGSPRDDSGPGRAADAASVQWTLAGLRSCPLWLWATR